MRILIINGPNINMIGFREKSIYGNKNYKDIMDGIISDNKDIDIEIYQTNIEGNIIDKLQSSMDSIDGLIINPGAFTHYSYAIYDALLCMENIPKVEVHISNIYSREEFRHKSVTAKACDGQISGFGEYGYQMAIDYIKKEL